MRVVVLGAGVVGVSSAYYLAQAGFAVTVIDRQPGAGLETSFANAGQISPGYAAPWAAPDIPFKALQWLFQRHAPLSIQADGTLWQWQWIALFLRNCTVQRYALNKARMLRLAEYSRACLQDLRAHTGIRYQARNLGTLQIFRNQQQLERANRDIAVLEKFGVAHALLDRNGCVRVEPALDLVKEKLTGGLHLPQDETGDCLLFTQALAVQAQQLGVVFRYNLNVSRVLHAQGRIIGIEAGGERIVGDHYLVALGSYSRVLLSLPGLNLPVYPVKGYSLTVPVIDTATAAAAAPRSTILDETYKVAITGFDNRIRIGGMAELAGFDLTLKQRRRATLAMVTADLFPQAGDLSKAEFWAGLRPMTPDGTPIIGATGYDNLWLNTGHGTLGWTMACGSAQLLADLMAGRRLAIPIEDYQLGRYENKRR